MIENKITSINELIASFPFQENDKYNKLAHSLNVICIEIFSTKINTCDLVCHEWTYVNYEKNILFKCWLQ